MDLTLPATLTHAHATAQLARWEPQLALLEGEPVTVDCAALAHFDSAALALVLELARRARAHGSVLQLRGVPQRLHDLAAVYGLETIWH
jgi:phospholipid transport system transporter-binding protein